VGEHALEVMPRAEQIAQEILRRTDQALADQAIGWLGPLRRQGMEPLGQRQSDAMPTAGRVKEPQAIERTQLVLDAT